MRRPFGAVAVLAALTVTSVGCAGGEPTGDGADATDPPSSEAAGGAGRSAEQWCSDMRTAKEALHDQYAESFGAAPDGLASPSSVLLSLDGSPAAVRSVRDYVAGLADGPAEIKVSSEKLVAELDEVLADLEANPDQPGAALTGAMGAIGVFSVMDAFALENCGETF